MTRSALVLLGLAACWREGPGPAPPPLRPEPVLPPEPEPETSKTGWKQSEPFTGAIEAEAPAAMRPEQIAAALATDLRANGANLMPSYVAGPAVVLDLDAGTLSVVCDAAAVAAAQTWGQMFADSARPRPHCRTNSTGYSGFACSQWASQQILIVDFADPDQWRIVSVIVGNFRAGRATMNAKIGQMRSLIATATCP